MEAKPPRAYCADFGEQGYRRQHAVPELTTVAVDIDIKELVQLAYYAAYKELNQSGAVADCNTCKHKMRCLFMPSINGTLHYEPTRREDQEGN